MDKKTVIKLHVIFWLAVSLVALFDTYVYLGNNPALPRLISAAIKMFFNILTFYIFYSFASSEIFKKRKIILPLILLTVYIFVFGYISAFTSYYPVAYVSAETDITGYVLAKGINNRVFDIIYYLSIVAILGIISKVTLIWYGETLRKKDIEKQNISNELAMLRAQINPHFLFNTLNNIKSLIKSLPPKAITSIDKLNGIMEYMFFGSAGELVPLENEINHINNYLDLEKIRFSSPDFIDFKIRGDFSKITIPPLIFMPFIENAFKHGNRLAVPPGIFILMVISGKRIHFEIKNFVKEHCESNNRNSGFGLVNIKRRLDLLYGNKYELEILNDKKIYSVKLNLNGV